MSDAIGAAMRRMAQTGIDVGGDRLQVLRPNGMMGTAEPGGASFQDTLAQAIGQVSAAQDTAADHVQRFVRGEQVELHQVMAATEEAGIALDLLIEIRNKITEAYRTVISMQG